MVHVHRSHLLESEKDLQLMLPFKRSNGQDVVFVSKSGRTLDKDVRSN